jgi:hypothetical protein
MSEDRRAPRLELSFPVLVETGGELRRHRAANVSETGMMFLAYEPYAIGTPCRVTFLLPFTDVELAAKAEVVRVSWIADPRVGLFKIGLRFVEFERDAQPRPLMALPC